MVLIVAPRHEPPSLLPNRTQFAARDIAKFVKTVLAAKNEESDEELFQICCDQFKLLCFSEVLSPLNSVIDQEAHDIHAIYTSMIVASLLCEEHHDVLVMLLFLVVEVSHCSVPLTVDEANRFSDFIKWRNHRPFILKILKKICEKSILVARKIPLYIDHSGYFFLRDNLREFTAKRLAEGAETGRAVSVEPLGTDDVGLVHTLTEQVIFELSAQTSVSNSLFRKECAEVISDLGNIIRPPNANRSSEDISLLPSKNVKRLLKTGRKK